jgi:GntR family transcriptional regulator
LADVPKAEEDAFDGRALHERIAADLRDETMSGDLAPGEALPSTQRLRDRFNASNATVQKALQLLKDERLVVGRAGVAVTVREHRQDTIRPADTGQPAAPSEQYRWLTAAKSGGKRGSIQLVGVTEVRPPAEVRAALDLGETGTAFLRYQILSYHDEPVKLVKSYYPAELARGTALAESRKIRGGTPALLAEMGCPPIQTVDRVSAHVPA